MANVERIWPEKQILDGLDYSLDMTDDLGVSDSVTSVVATVIPSGIGELAIGGSPDGNELFVTGNIITLWLTGGIGGRGYLVRLVIKTYQGRTFDVLITLLMSRTLMSFPVPEPPSTTFSGEAKWMLNTVFATSLIAGTGQVTTP